MKAIATAALVLWLGTYAKAQFVLPAAELAGIPAGDTQKVVLAGWQHCDLTSPPTCTTGGSPFTQNFASGGNRYDRAGKIFSLYSGNSTNAPLYLTSSNGTTKTTFGTLSTLCAQDGVNVILTVPTITAMSFNTVANELQLATANQTFTVSPVDQGSSAVCGGSLNSYGEGINYGAYNFTQGQDITYAYITITGSTF